MESPLDNKSEPEPAKVETIDIARSKPTSIRRRMLLDTTFASPRPLKKSTIERNLQLMRACRSEYEVNTDAFGKKQMFVHALSTSPQSTSQLTTQSVKQEETIPESRVFVFNGQQIILTTKSGSALLKDVHAFLIDNYSAAKGDVARQTTSADRSTQTSEQQHSSTPPRTTSGSQKNMVSRPDETHETNGGLLVFVTHIRMMASASKPLWGELTCSATSAKLVYALKTKQRPILIEAIWAVINITASSHPNSVNSLIASGVLPVLVELLLFDQGEICSNAAWALANIAGDGDDSRSAVISSGTLKKVLSLLDKDCKSALDLPLVRNVVWLLVNMCRPSKLNMVPLNQQLIPSVIKHIRHILKRKDKGIREDGFWALYYLLDPDDTKTMPTISDFSLIHICVAELNRNKNKLNNQVPLVRCLCLLSSVKSSESVHELLRVGLLGDPFYNLLKDVDQGFPLHALLILSNICLHGIFCVENIITSDILSTVLKCSAELRSRPLIFREVMVFLQNFCISAHVDQLDLFCTQRMHMLFLDGLCAFESEEDVVLNALQALHNLISLGFIKHSEILLREEFSVFYKLRRHCNEDIARLSNWIVKAVNHLPPVYTL